MIRYVAALALLLFSTVASAQWGFTPYVGLTLGGALNTAGVTYANLPAAAANASAIIRVTDVGSAGSLWISDGTTWRPLNGHITLAGSGVGYILPGVSAASNVSLTANVATVVNGAPTAHNIPATTFDGYNVYFPGSANIPAGWYPGFVRTSVNNYTFNYTHGNVASESVNGGAAYTAETTAVTYNLPGGAMGTNGSVRFHGFGDWNNSAGAKTTKVKFGGTIVLNFAPTTTLSARYDGPVVANMNSATSQISSTSTVAGAYQGAVALASSTVRTSINTAADVAVLVTLQAAAATDYVTLGPYYLELRVP